MEVKTTEYDTVKTGVYNGKHQVVVGYTSKDGDFKVRSFKVVRDGKEIFPPIAVTIGDTDTAVAFLTGWLKEITGKDYSPIEF